MSADSRLRKPARGCERTRTAAPSQPKPGRGPLHRVFGQARRDREVDPAAGRLAPALGPPQIAVDKSFTLLAAEPA